MFRRYGCGCIYLITQVEVWPEMNEEVQPTHGRLVEHCSGDDDNLAFGSEVEIAKVITPKNIADSQSLDADEENRLFGRINLEIHRGRQFTALTQVLKAAVNGN
jgi:hypothetical protein